MSIARIDARKAPSLRRTLAPIYPKLPFAKGSNRPEAAIADLSGSRRIIGR